MRKKFLWSGLLLLVFAVACQEENPESPQYTMNLWGDETLAENAGSTTISIDLEQPVPVAGTVRLLLSSDFAQDFTTVPERQGNILQIPVSAGAESITFTIIPVDNQLLEGDKPIKISIYQLPEGWLIGEKNEFILTLQDDEEVVSVAFAEAEVSFLENENAGYQVDLIFSHALVQEEVIHLSLNRNWDAEIFYTEPAATLQQQLVLNVPAGSISTGFKIFPKNNQVLSGHQQFNFTMVFASAGLQMGEQKSVEVTIWDDELKGKPRMFETTGGGWRSKETYTYDMQGRLHTIDWESETPGLKSGTKTLYYDENGLLNRVNHAANYDEYYYHQQGKIFKRELIRNDVLEEYSLYDYDPAGNLGGEAVYYRQPEGDFKLGFTHIYLYFVNTNNLFRHLIYAPSASNAENLILVATRTYENYLDEANPFPLRMIPTINSQVNLPVSIQIEEGGSNLKYNFSYTFDQQGLPIKRTTHGEQTIYEYY